MHSQGRGASRFDYVCPGAQDRKGFKVGQGDLQTASKTSYRFTHPSASRSSYHRTSSSAMTSSSKDRSQSAAPAGSALARYVNHARPPRQRL
jgi:hypothetical protein